MITDIYSLLAWAKEEELIASKLWCNDCSYLNDCRIEEDEVRTEILCALDVRMKAFREMIDRIEKSPIELHRTLTMPREFDLL